MAKLKLNPAPTFKAKVGIPVHGSAKPVEVEFTFKHRPRSDLMPWLDAQKERPDAELVMEIAEGWELDDEFNAENCARLCDNYAGAGQAIVLGYLEELSGHRAKN